MRTAKIIAATLALVIATQTAIVFATDNEPSNPVQKQKPQHEGKKDEKKEEKQPAVEPAPSLAVDLQLTHEVRERKPIEPGVKFTPGKVYAWTRVTGGKGETTVNHVWYREGKQVFSIPVSVKGKAWTTWSYMNVRPGAYKVIITDEDGKTMLQSAEFTVTRPDLAAGH